MTDALDRTYSLEPPQLGTSPPKYIYVHGLRYQVTPYKIPKPPLANTLKFINNWVGPTSRIAKNIWYALFPSSTPLSSPSFLQAAANGAMNSFMSVLTGARLSSLWKLNSVTAIDNSGTSTNQATSNVGSMPGTDSGPAYPPQCAVVLSWKTPITARGGRSRWYLPGVPLDANNATGDSALNPAYCAGLESLAAQWLSAFNILSIAGAIPTAGTISYQLHHAALPAPVFQLYTAVKVHERMDSQRRRSGKEATFGSVP